MDFIINFIMLYVIALAVGLFFDFVLNLVGIGATHGYASNFLWALLISISVMVMDHIYG